MRDKTGRPEKPNCRNSSLYDLETLGLFIPPNYIKSSMVETAIIARNDGTEQGRYGSGKYGRCLYGPAGPPGIYGYDTYGNSIYK